MRVISGSLKGKSIKFLKNLSTRPLKDAVKENIFNILKHSNLINVKIEEANILDLYSGFGSFGIECISRGAKKVIFVENHLEALKILNKNISQLNIEEKTKIINEDCFNFLNYHKNFKKKFQMVFMDPPYKEKKINYLIEEFKDKKILDEKGIIIIHRHKLDDIQISQKLKILDIRKYGISKIIIGN